MARAGTPPLAAAAAREAKTGEAEKVEAQKVDLRPCHVCFRKPTVRRDLDCFAGCEGCGGRTCFVCLRRCEGGGEGEGGAEEGGGGHRGVVCSRCCVERGVDGEVWCLGCLGGEGVGG